MLSLSVLPTVGFHIRIIDRPQVARPIGCSPMSFRVTTSLFEDSPVSTSPVSIHHARPEKLLPSSGRIPAITPNVEIVKLPTSLSKAAVSIGELARFQRSAFF